MGSSFIREWNKTVFSPIKHLLHEQSTNHISSKSIPRCYTNSPTAQDTFWPIPSLISWPEDGDCYFMHRMKSDAWPKWKSGRKTIRKHRLLFTTRFHMLSVFIVTGWKVLTLLLCSYAYFATVPNSERITHRLKIFAPQISINVHNMYMHLLRKNRYRIN